MAKLKCPKCFHINPEGQDYCVKCGTPLPKIRIEARPDTPEPVQPQWAQAPEIQFRAGQTVGQRYTVLRLIGRGGMGCIYKVHDNVLGEEVALKTLLPQLARDKLVVDRFFHEARIARRLAHPNIVRVHDIGSANNIIYISMEFLEGVSLRGALDRLKPAGRMPLLQTLTIIEELCAALEYAHQYTVHRDIKPENVMLGRDGRVKLMDFGISKLMGDTRLTGASVVMGTPFYMAPEQLRNSRDVDARADVYSVGVMLYELLTGNVPTGVPKPVSELLKDVPKELDAVIAKCVEPDPASRFQSAAELRAAVAPLVEKLSSGGIPLRRKTQEKPRPPASPRRLAGVLAALGVLVATGAAVFVIESRIQRQNAAAATEASTPALRSGRFAELAELVQRARAAADLKSSHAEGPLRAAFMEGERIWRAAEAEAGGNVEAAVTLGENALRCYLATLIWRPGDNLVFIAPGTTQVGNDTVDVPPFLIDETEVTAAQYRQFCERVDGGWPYPLAENYPPDWPMAWVTFYDAQAYAAWRDMLLPTEAQWARAAFGEKPSERPFPWGQAWESGMCKSADSGDPGAPAAVKAFPQDITRSGCWDMAGNVTEWTRTVAESGADGPQTPGFGVMMKVRGGNFTSTGVRLSDSYDEPYEQRRAELGFRCVKEIPVARNVVENILAAQ